MLLERSIGASTECMTRDTYPWHKRQEYFAPAMWIDNDSHVNVTESPKAIRPGGANRPYVHEDVDEDGAASCENTARLPRIDDNNYTNLPESPNIANGNSPWGRESPLHSRGC